MIKDYFKKKSKFGLLLNALTFILLVLLLIPATRKDVAALLLKPTRFIHQPKVKTNQELLSKESYAWKLQSLNGETVSFNDFKNKVVFINLWATWCPPCIAELDDMQKLYDSYGDRVSFLFISNENQTKLQEFINKKDYTIPVYVPLSNYPNDLETSTIPTTYVISKKGELVISKKGLANWNSQKVKNILDILINK